MNTVLDAFVVAVVGFVAAVALGMVVGRKKSREVRVLILLVALLGVAGLVQVTRPAFVIADPAPGPPTASPTPTPTPTPPTPETTSITPTETSTTPSPSPEPPRDRTAEFLALVPADQFDPDTVDVVDGRPRPNSRGAHVCQADNVSTWTYPVKGAYTSFRAVAVLSGAPALGRGATFTAWVDEKQVFSTPLLQPDRGVAVSAPVDVRLDQVQSLRLQVTAQRTDLCDSLVASWADIKVT